MSLSAVCLINVVGLTRSLIGSHTPVLRRLADEGMLAPLEEVLPAVTCSAQASMLTGTVATEHGIVGNGWYWRDLGEVRFWVQSNRLIRRPTLYRAAKRLARRQRATFTCAKLFWWFNQGAPVDWSVTPKPYYGADGSKVFAIHGQPQALPAWLEEQLGPFPFHAFWGPMSGIDSSRWIAEATALVIRRHRPTLTLCYLPHLDYDLQRYGPVEPVARTAAQAVDQCVARVVDACRAEGIIPVVVSEYGLVPVCRPVYVNRFLRSRGWLVVRPGPFGETLETYQSHAFAVVDHQVAHVYVRPPRLRAEVAEALAALEGVAAVLADRDAKRAAGLDHPRAGDLILLAEPDAWFAYPYWLDDRSAPDFARTVDIHRKPGYDPCELFFDPALRFPKLRVARRLLARKLGFRALFDVVPLDAELVRGSHGLRASEEASRPVYIGPRLDPPPRRVTDVYAAVLRLLGFEPAAAQATPEQERC